MTSDLVGLNRINRIESVSFLLQLDPRGLRKSAQGTNRLVAAHSQKNTQRHTNTYTRTHVHTYTHTQIQIYMMQYDAGLLESN